MLTPASPPPGVYHSRSRVARNRLVLAAAGLALVLLGYLIGRLQDGPPAPAAAVAVSATLKIEDTGGWQEWESQTADLRPSTGRHTVFMTFGRDGGGDFVNLNYFAFAH